MDDVDPLERIIYWIGYFIILGGILWFGVPKILEWIGYGFDDFLDRRNDREKKRIENEIRKMVLIDWGLSDEEYQRWMKYEYQTDEWKKANLEKTERLIQEVEERCWRQFPNLFSQPTRKDT